jgi:hypothetical protein
MSEESAPPVAETVLPPSVPRPRPVFWTGIICLLFGTATLGVQALMTWQLGRVDVSSYIQGTIFLIAGSLNFGMPRSRAAFEAGAVALIVLVIRCVSTVPNAFRNEYMTWIDRLTTSVMGVALTAGFIRLTWLFIKSRPSREYFKLPA